MSVVLRLHPEDTLKPIDFRKPRWGHAMHGDTFQPEPRQWVRVWSWLPWIKVPEPKSVRRISVMAHTSDSPTIGREVIWNAIGGERRGRIYDVEFCRNPEDMMTLKIVIGEAP